MVTTSVTDALRAAQSPVSRDQPGVNALVFGAVGKMGEELLTQVLSNPAYKSVYVATRRELGSTIAKLEPVLFPGEELPSGPNVINQVTQAHDVYCCLCDTRTFYRRDDVYHRVQASQVIDIARACLAAGAKRLVLVKPTDAMSQLGGYGRFLTDAEEVQLIELPFQTLVIIRPASDSTAVAGKHFLQRLAGGVLNLLGSYMIPARLHPRRTKTVVKACIQALESRGTGIHIISLDQLEMEGA
jgi:hypothetical protein